MLRKLITIAFLFFCVQQGCAGGGSCKLGATWSTTLDFAYTSKARGLGLAVDTYGSMFVALEATDSGGINHWMVQKSSDGGTSWSIVDDYQYTSGVSSAAISVASDPVGNIYVVGEGDDGVNGKRLIVRKSLDSGKTWVVVDDFQYVTGKSTFVEYITSNDLGEIFTVSRPLDSTDKNHSLIRKSTDAGKSWTTIDDFQFVAGQSTNSTFLTLNQKGHLFLATSGVDSSSVSHWLVRKSTDRGLTWTIIDDYLYVTGKSSSARTLLFDRNGVFYVFGYGFDATNKYHWIVRKSVDDGVTWTIVDDYQYESGENSFAWSAFSDNHGQLYAIGFVTQASGDIIWLVRRTNDAGTTWSNVDEFQYSGGQNSQAKAAVIGPGGSLFIIGYGSDSGFLNYRSVVRKLECAG